MPQRKHSSKWILERVHEYLSGQGSFKSIAESNGVSSYSLQTWVYKYKAHGEMAFIDTPGNKRYSKEFKLKCIEEVVDDLIERKLIFKNSPCLLDVVST